MISSYYLLQPPQNPYQSQPQLHLSLSSTRWVFLNEGEDKNIHTCAQESCNDGETNASHRDGAYKSLVMSETNASHRDDAYQEFCNDDETNASHRDGAYKSFVMTVRPMLHIEMMPTRVL